MRYELGFYIPEDGILHIHCRENLKYSNRLQFREMPVVQKSLRLHFDSEGFLKYTQAQSLCSLAFRQWDTAYPVIQCGLILMFLHYYRQGDNLERQVRMIRH
jgi:hypothetical protein